MMKAENRNQKKNVKYEGIACSVFSMEIRKLIAEGKVNLPFRYLDSALHMTPVKLQKELDNEIKRSEKPVLLCFGDCHGRIVGQKLPGKGKKIPGINCIEIILGKDLYRANRAKGYFFLLPEWALRWRELFIVHLGFDKPELAREFMKSNHSSFMYIDTGVIPVPYQVLKEIEDHFQMKTEVTKADLNKLESIINQTVRS